MKIITTFGSPVECEPTEEGLRAIGLPTKNLRLVISNSNNCAYLIPVAISSGSVFSINDKCLISDINKIKIKHINKKVLNQIKHDINLLNFKFNYLKEELNFKFEVTTFD